MVIYRLQLTTSVGIVAKPVLHYTGRSVLQCSVPSGRGPSFVTTPPPR